MNKLLFTRSNHDMHWVGDGFPVRTIFSYHDQMQHHSPFLLMDYGGPTDFGPSPFIRGVGEHPHRGFETVTIVFDGEVEHRDSAGGGGRIGPGDVQWMTAGSGLVHEEKHGQAYAEKGGPFEMVQLWVNLPAKDKMTSPHYQGIKAADIPVVTLPIQAGRVRVIAGSFQDQCGPARVHTPINLWDVRLEAGKRATFSLPRGHNTSLFVRRGTLELRTGERLEEATLAVLEANGEEWSVSSENGIEFLVLSGEPIREPVVGYGPFVMNSREEIIQAFADLEAGRMGKIAVAGSELI